MYNQNWGQNMQWGSWSPQYPKQSRPQQRRSRDGGDRGKDRKKEEGVARPYDSSAPPSSQPQSSSGSAESQFMKEFMEMARENKMPIPERLQKLLPDGTKDAIRDQQRKLNRHRNVVNKIESKKKALEMDKERWSNWLQEMKEQIVKQRGNFEENQKKLLKELEALEEEEKKIRTQDTKEEEEEEDPDHANVEQMLDAYMEEVKDGEDKTPTPKLTGVPAAGSTELKEALEVMQQQMETRYQEKLQAQQRVWEEKWTKLQIAQVVELSDGEGTAPGEQGASALVPLRLLGCKERRPHMLPHLMAGPIPWKAWTRKRGRRPSRKRKRGRETRRIWDSLQRGEYEPLQEGGRCGIT